MTIERHKVNLETPEGRAGWLALRRQDITASDIGAICGVEAFKSALGVWMDKAGLAKADEDSNLMRRGRHLEDAVINYLKELWPKWRIEKPGIYLRDTDARIGATPDAVALTADGQTIIQCKVVARPIFDRSWEDEPPLCYQMQAATEAFLYGADSAIIAALSIDAFNTELYTFKVDTGPAIEAIIRKKVAAFWASVDAGEAPKADYSRDAELLQQLYQTRPRVEAVDLSHDNMLPIILDERVRLMAEVKEREKRIEEIKCEVLVKLGQAERGILPGYKISNTLTNRKEYVVKAASYPTLRITKEKEKE